MPMSVPPTSPVAEETERARREEINFLANLIIDAYLEQKGRPPLPGRYGSVGRMEP